MIAGRPDALLRVRVRTQEDLGELLMRLREHKLVRDTKGLVVASRWWHGVVEISPEEARA
jgi:hypothetical protein